MIVKNNRVAIKPFADDMRALEVYLSDRPFPNSIPLEHLALTIIYSTAPIQFFEPDNKTIHKTIITGGGILYDDHYEIRNIVIKLEAPTLEKRRKEIEKTYGAISTDKFEPHLTVVYNLPVVLRGRYRWWVNQFENNFESTLKGKVLRFQGEVLQTTDRSIYTSE